MDKPQRRCETSSDDTHPTPITCRSHYRHGWCFSTTGARPRRLVLRRRRSLRHHLLAPEGCELPSEMTDDPRPGHTEGVTQRDGPTVGVDVELVLELQTPILDPVHDFLVVRDPRSRNHTQMYDLADLGAAVTSQRGKDKNQPCCPTIVIPTSSGRAFPAVPLQDVRERGYSPTFRRSLLRRTISALRRLVRARFDSDEVCPATELSLEAGQERLSQRLPPIARHDITHHLHRIGDVVCIVLRPVRIPADDLDV